MIGKQKVIRLGFCKRCNRRLKSPQSIYRGYGYHCYKRKLNEYDEWFNKVQVTIFDFL